MNLQHLLEARFQLALTGLVASPEEYQGLVRPTRDPKHGDYQANLAMPLAKALGQKPRDVAMALLSRLNFADCLDTPEVAGPGFINLRFTSAWLGQALVQLAQDERLGVAPVAHPRRIVIDYSSPNVAKPLHVGHLRSTIIGDALTRLLRFLGHIVITDNHLGDWGTQFGILIWGYKNFRDEAALAADPVRELLRIYVLVREKIKAAGAAAGDEEEEANNPIAEACRQETAKLHSGDPENVELWKRMMPWCLEDLNRLYRRMGVSPFDHTLGESHYNPELAGIVKDLQAKGIAVPSRGALAIFFGENEPPALVRKGDGAFTYMTTDLATIRYRVNVFKADLALYVVDKRQALHFKQLFTAAKRWGFDQMELVHVAFGTVLGEDGTPLKARDGKAQELAPLLDEAVAEARKIIDANSPELSEAERAQVAEQVGIGAVKYADLSQNRISDYVFSWPKMLAMDGNTATYMQYAHARVRSIFRKGNVDPAQVRAGAAPPTLHAPEERALALQLLRLPEALALAAQDYAPSAITSYLWDLAKTYSGFFQNCPVLKAETPQLRQGRLLLCDLTGRTLRLGLDLLGIQAPERM
jgi:arginyl-tRNA synthetase